MTVRVWLSNGTYYRRMTCVSVLQISFFNLGTVSATTL